MAFCDRFGKAAEQYARHRPRYPAELFSYLASHVNRHDLAWDAGTGSGQAAIGLAPHFRRVVATDASAGQLSQALPHERVEYRRIAAEDIDLPAHSTDIVTVAQAVHWFDLDRFYAAVRRVGRPGGSLAIWCYGLPAIADGVDAVLDRFYNEVTGPYWAPARKFVDDRYRTLPFPFEEMNPPPEFEFAARWGIDDLFGFLQSWSAVAAYRAARDADPLDEVRDDFTRAWSALPPTVPVRWPIYLRVGRIAG
jgi:SAM-dependent methyltransferase